MKNITKNTKVEFKTVAMRGGRYGSATVEVGQVFNFEGFLMELTKEQKEFINSLNHKDFKKIPDDMLDMTTVQNFRCYLRLV